MQTLAQPGRRLGVAERSFFESRFGRDFSEVRVHDDAAAGRSARDVNALAYTVGRHIAFAPGQFRPQTDTGRALIGHELAHVVQQGGAHAPSPHQRLRIGAPHSTAERQVHSIGGRISGGGLGSKLGAPLLQRKPASEATAAPTDPLCAQFDAFIDGVITEGSMDDFEEGSTAERRLSLVRDLKWFVRCGSPSEQTDIRTELESKFGKKTADSLWMEAGRPLGGYRGAYPGYYGGAKGRLERLGLGDVDAYDAFSYDTSRRDPDNFRTRSEAQATAEAPVLEGVDLLYFYGHQYAQYENPGVFANGAQTKFIDLRALSGKGDFSRVKLIVSTSCATCCAEAVSVFSGLFPNAVILGYRKSAPISGSAVRDAFDKGIRDLKRPLFLDQEIDVNAIIGVWKSIVGRFHPNEAKRLPGYYKSGTVHYLEFGTWKSVSAKNSANTCKKKGSTVEEAAH